MLTCKARPKIKSILIVLFCCGLTLTASTLETESVYAASTTTSSLNTSTLQLKPSISNTKKTIKYGGTYKLSMKNANGKVTWSSSNTSIATVTQKGNVKGKGIGKCTITAKIAGSSKKYTCAVTIRKLRIAVPGNTDSEKKMIDSFGYAKAYTVYSGSIDKYDGLLLPGGGDLDPSRYGESNTASRCIDNQLDTKQLKLLAKFVKAKKPVLGICKGIQLINVYFGGSLYQDVSGHMGVNHTVTCCKSGSLMEKLYGNSLTAYSSHHQAIKKLGKGLVVTQKCGNVVEAIEHKTLPIYGVQWHPDLMMNLNVGGKAQAQKLIRYYLKQCSLT